jgi:putative DNA primase/helicase
VLTPCSGFFAFYDTLPRSLKPRPHGLVVVRLSKVESKRVEWIWPGRIARGKLTIVSGLPDGNKSTFLVDLFARITRGGPLPAVEGVLPQV